jgi:hypothetical protein
MNYLLSLIFWTLNIFQTDTTITFPRPGDALQGMVTIVGSTQVIGFVSSEISFTYSGSSTATWFLLSKSEQMVQNGILAEWDTSLISDGNYDLRLRTFLNDGTSIDKVIEKLQIRNYTSVETPLFSPTTSMQSRTTDVLVQELVSATPFTLPPNPMELTNHRLLRNLGLGVLATISIYLVISLFIKLRWKKYD